MADFDKNMIFTPGLCGHFALGTLSETYLEDAVFKINVQDQNITNKYKIKKRIRTSYYFVSINTSLYGCKRKR